ncbi:MAG: beta-lactamase family protein, partial [Pseudomonadales bacterium]|nr:beta-lactamase family protein [Pseudomonadales bacterium]
MGGCAIQLELHGDVDRRFAPVADALRAGFESGEEAGASLAVVLEGRLVVDLWAGTRDRRGQKSWEQDTLCCFFSISKALTALCVLQAVAEELIDLEAPVARYWPEFAAEGKDGIQIRHLLTHQAGLVGFHEALDAEDFYDWEIVTRRLAAERPWWSPGEKHGYHARTFGWLLGEVLRRATGSRVAEWLQDRISGPRGLDIHLGLQEAQLPRCADMLPARIRPGSGAPLSPEARAMLADFRNLDTPTGAAFQNPALGPGYMNTERFRRLEQPAISGHGTARSLARLFGALDEILPAQLLAEATRVHSFGTDAVLKAVSCFGLGLMVYDPQAPIGVRPGTFGHAGAGGSMAYRDPVAGVGFCYLMNQMQEGA